MTTPSMGLRTVPNDPPPATPTPDRVMFDVAGVVVGSCPGKSEGRGNLYSPDEWAGTPVLGMVEPTMTGRAELTPILGMAAAIDPADIGPFGSSPCAALNTRATLLEVLRQPRMDSRVAVPVNTILRMVDATNGVGFAMARETDLLPIGAILADLLTASADQVGLAGLLTNVASSRQRIVTTKVIV